MPETFSPIIWRNDQNPALNESNLNRLEQGVELLDDRIATLELGVVTPVVVPFATSVTLNATQGALFRCVASGDLTLDDIVGGVDGQVIVFEMQASGAQRILHFTGSTDSVTIAIGQWWVGQFRYIAAASTWLLDDGSGGGGSSGSGNDLNILAPQNIPYASTITPNAAAGALFRITAVGDVTLADPINGTDGQAVVVEILASGGSRTVTFANGSVGPVTLPTGTRWSTTMRYNAGANAWVVTSTPGSTGGSTSFAAMQLSDVATLRGVNWYGMEDGLRGPNLTELQDFVARKYSMVRIPVNWTTSNAAIAAILANADNAGIWVGVEVHNYGRIGGTASINATDGTVITSSNQQQWFDKCIDQLNAFKQYKSYVPLDMNEPKQTGAEWEPISQGRITALRNAGWAGPIGVSAAKVSSAGGINNSDAHPGGWWINDAKAFLEVHQYLPPLSDVTLQTRSELNAWVVSSSGQADLTTYVDYIHRAFYFGAFGDSRWASVPMLIGEFAMPPGLDTELEQFLDEVDTRGVGVLQWGAGMWPSTYNWKMTSAQYVALTAHSSAVQGSGASVASVNGMTGTVVLDADDLGDGSAKVMMTTAERTKLTGVASGATANSTDAQLRSRATHTGTQAISTVTGLQTALDSKPDAALTSSLRSASYTITAADIRVEQVYTGSTSATFTLPNDTSATIAVGESVPLRQSGTGQLTIAAASGVTISSRGAAVTLAGQHAVAEARKTGANAWLLYGDIV